MIFGILKERQPDECRVAPDLAGVERLVAEMKKKSVKALVTYHGQLAGVLTA